MVENRPWFSIAAHAVLLLGVLVIGFPIYMTFVASTHLSGPVPLLPGRFFVDNYGTVLFSGLGASSSAPPVGFMMFNSLIMALAIAFGKIAISITSLNPKIVTLRWSSRTTRSIRTCRFTTTCRNGCVFAAWRRQKSRRA
jgi:sn-glycerol 3-phosphate transport system permease protein